MGDDLSIVETLVFAIVAVILFVRLRSVLGKRTGNERPRGFQPFNPTSPVPPPPPNGERPTGEIVQLTPPRPGVFRPETGNIESSPQPLASGIAQIKSADPQFDEDVFLGGARGAFEMIVEAYARGDTETLRPLLAPPVYENFATAVRNRQAAGEHLETSIASVQAVDLVEASLSGRTASATVKFISEQINVTRDSEGNVLDGDPNEAHEVVDIWIFGRDTRSKDPNWQLIATRTPS